MAKQEEIALTEAEYQLLQNLVIDATVEDYKENINYSELKMAAQRFIDTYTMLDQQQNAISKSFIRNIVFKENYHIQNMQGGKGAYLLRAKYLAAFQFQAAINKFLGEVPSEALYVYEDAEGNLQTFKMSMTELAARTTAEGRLSMSLSQLTAESRESFENQKELDLEQMQHYNTALCAYKGTVARLNRFYEEANKGKSKKERINQGGLLMWRLSKDWIVARVSNKGDLKEAYAQAIMAEHKRKCLCSIDTGNPEFYSHNLISQFYYNYIYNVTNKPAIVEEDIVTGTVQYAVKGNKAEMPALKQYLDTANALLDKSDKAKDLSNSAALKTWIQGQFPQDVHRNAITTSFKNTEKINEEAIIQKLQGTGYTITNK